MSEALTELAPAKVNLTLRVTGRRADGYHLLDSLVVFGPAADIVHARPSDRLTLDITGPFAAGLSPGPDNLVLRAARALADLAGRPANAALTLAKHLPVASGIGGGSADAAATLRVLCRLWRLTPSAGALAALALTLGADVPVCLASHPARMRGVGEILDPVPPPPPCGLLLANPGIAVATADIFRHRTAPFSPPMALPAAWPDLAAFTATLAASGNDLATPAQALQPTITAVLTALRALPGCRLARMSGSGATCFALFDSAAKATAAAPALPQPWWRSAGPLYEPPAPALLEEAPGWGVAKW